MSQVVILGAGISGMGASYALNEAGVDATIFEKRSRPGGHTSSHHVGDGFIIDEGPHVSFTQVDRMQEILAGAVDQKYETIQTYVDNYWQGHWIKHPAICNLHGLPTDLNVQIIQDFVACQSKSDETANVENFGQWLCNSYGETYAKTFPYLYNKKYHTVDVENMSVDWLGPRLYRASLDEVIRGALTPETADVHYIDHFRYPTDGGFEGYLHKFQKLTPTECDHEVTEIDPAKRKISFANGKTVDYKGVVSSIALPDLIDRIPTAPKEVKDAAAQLACSTCVCVTVGVDRENVTKANWTYFYDMDISFARTSAPKLLSPNTCPDGTSSIQCEVYFSNKYRPLEQSFDEIKDQVIADLKKVGLLKEDDKLLFEDVRLFKYANIIFDLDRAKVLPIVHGYLQEQGINYCGRYGDWGYMWTDQSFLSGEQAAKDMLKNL